MARKVTVENIDRTIRVYYRLPTQRELQILTTLANDEFSSIIVKVIRDRQVHDSIYYRRALLQCTSGNSDIRSDVFYQLMLNGWIEPYTTKIFIISTLGKSLLDSLTYIHHRHSIARQSA